MRRLNGSIGSGTDSGRTTFSGTVADGVVSRAGSLGSVGGVCARELVTSSQAIPVIRACLKTPDVLIVLVLVLVLVLETLEKTEDENEDEVFGRFFKHTLKSAMRREANRLITDSLDPGVWRAAPA